MWIIDVGVCATVEGRALKTGLFALGVLLLAIPGSGAAGEDLTALPFEELLQRDFVSASRQIGRASCRERVLDRV